MLYRYTSLLRALDFVLCSRMLRALGMCALAPITRGAWTVSHAPHKSIRQPNSAAPPASFCSSALRVSCRVFGMTGICSMIYYHIFTADNHSAVSPNYLSRPSCSNTPGLSHAASLSILRRLRMVPFVLLDEPFLRMTPYLNVRTTIEQGLLINQENEQSHISKGAPVPASESAPFQLCVPWALSEMKINEQRLTTSPHAIGTYNLQQSTYHLRP